ncbi:hypothetical protein Nepgr_028105 [Nepenthes gracilis]|uniref:Uncharacterized protein n=1 Tax=Nepenthes gracilis TaxID=150966 RepID=A0AAD3Y1T6_NEPGR|nr:hypothetical protein Nepgr_028105 [Nepenthes gracilis]
MRGLSPEHSCIEHLLVPLASDPLFLSFSRVPISHLIINNQFLYYKTSNERLFYSETLSFPSWVQPHSQLRIANRRKSLSIAACKLLQVSS